MTNLQQAQQEVLELEIDYDQVISDFEQLGDSYPIIEVESNNYWFTITFKINGSLIESPCGWHDYDDPIEINFSGEIIPYEIEVFDKSTEKEFELRVTKQITEQLKIVE